MTCQTTQTDRTIIALDGSATVIRKILGFVPRLIVVDNMSDAAVHLYDGAYADPINQRIGLLDYIPPRCFKVIVLSGSANQYTIAWAAGETAGQYISLIVTDDLSYANQFHQQINPVNVAVRSAGSDALTAGTVDAEASTGSAVPVSADLVCSEVTIQNPATATGSLKVGSSSAQTITLAAGEWITLPVANTNLVYVIGATAAIAAVPWIARS